MTKDEAIERLKTSATVEDLWLMAANNVNVGEPDEWYDEIYSIEKILQKRYEKSFVVKSIQSINFDDINVKQYFVFVINGKNGCSDYVEDVLTPILSFFKIIQENGAKEVVINDYMADVIDDTYAWVLSFTVKNDVKI